MKKTLPIIFMVLSWAVYYALSKWAVDTTESVFLAGFLLRAAALVILTLYLVLNKKVGALTRVGKAAILLLLIGVLGYLLDSFANIGFLHGSVSTGTVLLKTDIVMANIATALLFKEKLYLSDWLATLVMLAGVILVLDIDYSALRLNIYDLFFVASAACVTANAFIIKRAQSKHGIDGDIIAFYNNLVVLVLFALSTFAAGDFVGLQKIDTTWTFWLLVFVGGLAQSCIYIFYYRNLKANPVWKVKLYLLFVPIVSAIIGVCAFGESFGLMKICGVVLIILGGVAVILRDKLHKETEL